MCTSSITPFSSAARLSIIFGDGGADRLKGSQGDDVLHGGPGADNLNGGPDFDICNGNGGADSTIQCETDNP